MGRRIRAVVKAWLLWKQTPRQSALESTSIEGSERKQEGQRRKWNCNASLAKPQPAGWGILPGTVPGSVIPGQVNGQDYGPTTSLGLTVGQL